jgi:hypothetical protein
MVQETNVYVSKIKKNVIFSYENQYQEKKEQISKKKCISQVLYGMAQV